MSGDNLSDRVPVPTADAVGADENLEINSTLEDDNLSIISDGSDDFIMPNLYPNNNNNNNVNNNNNNNPRRGNRELNSLGSVPPLPRLRPRLGRQ